MLPKTKIEPSVTRTEQQIWQKLFKNKKKKIYFEFEVNGFHMMMMMITFISYVYRSL